MTPEKYARVQELFLEACELGAADREQFLAQRCAGDTELREEVAALLAHDDSQTLIGAGTDAGVSYRAGTAVQPGTRLTGRHLRTLGLITKRLGPRGHLAWGMSLACVVFIAVGLFVNQSVGAYQKLLQAEALQEILDAKIAGLEMWFEHQQEMVQSWTRSREFQRLASELVQLAVQAGDDQKQIRQADLQTALEKEIHQLAGSDTHYAIWDRRSITIADTLSAGRLIGVGVTPFGAAVLSRVFDGEARMFLLDTDHTITRCESSISIAPTLSVVAPIYDAQGSVIAALQISDVDSRNQASRILRMVELGESGETYAFNKYGELLSESRFDDQLRQIGLLPSDEHVGSFRTVHLRDPGGDMTAGYRPQEPLSTCPLTKMARHATAGEDGVDVDGYRDYRGVMVVGAWRWLDDYDFGLATELDLRESEPGHWILVLQIWIVLGLFAISLGFLVYSYYSIHKLRSEIGEYRRVGRYTLQQQIGEGGMGKVYKARHEFLKRPTAIKLLKPELVDKQSISRFEQEASSVSQLTHPNTVDIYDYGVTPEGLFFFVMEYIDGLSLLELVQQHGPVPPPRVIYLLTQICESLGEAHNAGMIHRDLKPQNVMICCRGGKADVVKVLDFGLVKHTGPTSSPRLTASALLAGTPLYIAPERVRDPSSADPRTDIYSLGAVTYFLLTGHEIFEGKSVADILYQLIQTKPPRPSATQPGIPQELDQLVVDCLAKDPNRRPGSVVEILRVLADVDCCPQAWDQALAQRWWRQNYEKCRQS